MEEKKGKYDLLAPTAYEVPEELIAQLIPDENDVKQSDDQSDRFNDRGKHIVRDTVNYVTGPEEIRDKINTHDYEADPCGKALCFLTCGLKWVTSRRVIEDGYFGHYMSSERHMFTTPGIRHLSSCTDVWMPSIPMDDQDQRSNHHQYRDVNAWGRVLGSKYLVTVPENHLGGAYRIGKPTEDSEDGQFVLFQKGRHVLDAYKYKNIQIASLERVDGQALVELGPITILYLKDGQLGGAFDVWEGVYKLFYPGAPLLLHEQDFRDISCVKTTLDPYRLGPYTFVTVQKGKLAGAYSKQTGKYQILPPGNTYWLHSKDWIFDERKDMCTYSQRFELGPYIYCTVPESYVAGVFHKKTGEFIELPAGKTYRLNKENYEKPIVNEKKGHVVQCGPLTFLTVESGTLNGGYKVRSGKFEEFDDPDKNYRLHKKEYRDIITIPRIRNHVQKFGFFKAITVPPGSVGIFEKAGQIQDVKESGPGYYKLPPEYRILPMMRVNPFTMSIPSLLFNTKDGIKMSANTSLVWKITDPKSTSLITPDDDEKGSENPSFNTLKKNVKKRLQLCVMKQVMKFNRDELLPTQQDVALKFVDATQEEKEQALAEVNKGTTLRYRSIEANCLKEFSEASLHSKWGISIDTIKLEGVELKDVAISNVLGQITETVLAIKGETIKGALSFAEEDQNNKRIIEETEMKSSVDIEKAKASALRKIRDAEAESEVKTTRAKTNADDAVHKATTENAAKVSLAKDREQANSDARTIRLQIENREKLSAAKAEAQSIILLADAEYEQQVKLNEAAEKMSQKQFNLQMSQRSVAAMNALSGCAWRMPDKVLEFYEQFSPMLEVKQT